MAVRRYGRISFETSNEDKVLFPDCGITKGDLIEYYERIADFILPHLDERPLVVQRFPDGIGRSGFYQKQAGGYFPEWVATERVALRSRERGQDLVVCDTKATLAYLANQACITLHPWLSRRDRLDHPDLLVVDLDPPHGDFEIARRAALRLRELLDELGLASFPKLTGSKGIHVVVPLDRKSAFDEVRAFARSVAEVLAARQPDELTTEQRKEKRKGRLFLDVGRNAYGQTAVAPYSVRALPEAPVAMPVAWRDLETKGLGPRAFTLKDAAKRVERREDPWKGMRRRARSLAAAATRLERLAARAGS